MKTVFFSWQADTDTKIGRNLIERALTAAIDRIGADADVKEAERDNDLALDKDTQGVAGTPPIVETIFGKIDNAAVFVPDLTFVGTRLDGRPTANPNVLIEYGWALKSRTHSRVVGVMNAAFGEPTTETMPFDMRHVRFPVTYNCPPGADDAKRKTERDLLSKKLEAALRAVLELGPLELPTEPNLFVPRAAVDGRGRLKASRDPIGVIERVFGGSAIPLKLAATPLMWLRVMPKHDPGKSWSVAEIENAATRNSVVPLPLAPRWAGYGYFRGPDLFGVYPSMASPDESALAAVMILKSGEVWSVDAYHVDAMGRGNTPTVPLKETDWIEALTSYTSLLKRLGLDGPYRWIAGIEGIKGRSIFPRNEKGYSTFDNQPRGHCLEDVVVVEGEYFTGQSASEALKPFFDGIYEACAVSRPGREGG